MKTIITITWISGTNNESISTCPGSGDLTSDLINNVVIAQTRDKEEDLVVNLHVLIQTCTFDATKNPEKNQASKNTYASACARTRTCCCCVTTN